MNVGVNLTNTIDKIINMPIMMNTDYKLTNRDAITKEQIE